jgi:hypothetical protein
VFFVPGDEVIEPRTASSVALHGDLKALRTYHSGDRTDPRVIAYF